MDRNHFFSLLQPLSPLRNLFFFIFFCLQKMILAADFQYEACGVRTTCGDQRISFPFYIPGQQEPYCGYPGFEVSCRNNTTLILPVPDKTDFIIHDIFYQNQSLRVSNSVALDAGESNCIPPIKNTSLLNDRVELTVNEKEVFLLFGCNLTVAKGLSEYMVNCAEQNVDDCVLALFGADSVLGNAAEKCKEVVAAPADAGGGGNNSSVGDMLRRGFVMKWIASNCSICEESGGRCGLDNSTFHFKCFCPDRPHASQCHSTGTCVSFFIYDWISCIN